MTDNQQASQPSTSGESMFALGTSSKANESTKKTGEQRIQEAFGTGDNNGKRDREKFAVDLRKKKREEFFKAKRNVNSDSQPNANVVIPTPATKEEKPKLMDVNLDEALKFAGTVPQA